MRPLYLIASLVTPKQNAIHDWELKVALDKYRNYQLAEKTKEEAIQKWEKFCHRK